MANQTDWTGFRKAQIHVHNCNVPQFSPHTMSKTWKKKVLKTLEVFINLHGNILWCKIDQGKDIKQYIKLWLFTVTSRSLKPPGNSLVGLPAKLSNQTRKALVREVIVNQILAKLLMFPAEMGKPVRTVISVTPDQSDLYCKVGRPMPQLTWSCMEQQRL